MKNISFRVRNFEKEKFLTFNIDNDAELDEELLDFLEDEEPEGIVPVIFEEGEEFDTFSYDITDKIRLRELSSQEINAEMVLMVIRGLTLSMMNMAEYRIPLSYLVLNRQYIYIDSDYKVEFVCIPLEDMKEEVDLTHFLRNFIASLRFDPSENGDYVAKLLTYINNRDIFNLHNLLSLVEELMENHGIDIPEAGSNEIYGEYQEIDSDEYESGNQVEDGQTSEEGRAVGDILDDIDAADDLEDAEDIEQVMDNLKDSQESINESEEEKPLEEEESEAYDNVVEDADEDVSESDTVEGSDEDVSESDAVEGSDEDVFESDAVEGADEDVSESDAVEESDGDASESEVVEESDDDVSESDAAEEAEVEAYESDATDKAEDEASGDDVVEESENSDDQEDSEDNTPETDMNDDASKEEEPARKRSVFKTRDSSGPVGVVIEDDLDEFLAEKEREDQETHHEDTGLKIRKGIKINRASIVKNTQEELKAEEAEEENSRKVESEDEADEVLDSADDKDVDNGKSSSQGDDSDEKESSSGIGQTIENAANSIKNATGSIPKVNPYLIRVNTDERIMITKQTFKLGKAGMGVDYTVKGNGAISRVHAIITGKDGEYYIKDNKSTNHTFVNGKVVEEGESELLTNDCKIMLGDEEFVFKTQ